MRIVVLHSGVCNSRFLCACFYHFLSGLLPTVPYDVRIATTGRNACCVCRTGPAAIVPFFAYRQYGNTFKWLLYGDDDTIFFMPGK
jgi:hypothetical protein